MRDGSAEEVARSAGEHEDRILGRDAREEQDMRAGEPEEYLPAVPFLFWVLHRVGLNLGLPFGTSLVGAGLDAASGGFVITGFLVGGAIGFVVAPIIDFGALAYKPIEEEGEAQAGVPRFNLTPIVGQGQTGLSFSMQF
jgi:hypothetical protein